MPRTADSQPVGLGHINVKYYLSSRESFSGGMSGAYRSLTAAELISGGIGPTPDIKRR
jgi:hypothetical protein